MTHLDHFALASGAPIAFFATKCATPSTKQHTHPTSSVNAVPYTLEPISLLPEYLSTVVKNLTYF
jgi:hypothetical protein